MSRHRERCASLRARNRRCPRRADGHRVAAGQLAHWIDWRTVTIRLRIRAGPRQLGLRPSREALDVLAWYVWKLHDALHAAW